MRNKGTIIAVSVVALVLLVSAGIAAAAGVSGNGSAVSRTEDGVSGNAGDAFSFGFRNGGEESNIRAENRTGVESGACEGDCDGEKLREHDCEGECDGTCDGDGMQNHYGAGDRTLEQGRLCDGSCDSCDGSCGAESTQSRVRGRE